MNKNKLYRNSSFYSGEITIVLTVSVCVQSCYKEVFGVLLCCDLDSAVKSDTNVVASCTILDIRSSHCGNSI